MSKETEETKSKMEKGTGTKVRNRLFSGAIVGLKTLGVVAAVATTGIVMAACGDDHQCPADCDCGDICHEGDGTPG